jgi:hypothetical protein
MREDFDRPEGDPSLIRPYVGGRHLDDAVVPERADPGLRPYMLTGGRTSPAGLEIEAQVETTEAGRGSVARLSFERRDIVLLCRAPVAVAEVAAQLNLHLGVVRVLVADLVGEGYLMARRPEAGLERSVPIIERVIRGLQAIR